MKLDELWSRRRETYLKRVLPYWRYVLSSSGLAVAFAAILAMQGYSVLLQRVREAGEASGLLPLGAAFVLAAALLWNPVRTYLVPADLVFLLPLEGQMRSYWRGSWRLGAAMSLAVTAAVLALYSPLYTAAGFGDGTEYALVAAALLALKGLLYYGAWRERQFQERSEKRLFAAVKAIAALAAGYALLGGASAPGAYWIVLIWAAYAACLRLPAAHQIHWQQLLEEERRTLARHEAFFGWFIDVPGRVETYKPRRFLNGLLRAIRYRRENAYLYLYWRTLLRSSMFPMALRVIVLEFVLIWIFPHPWAATAIYVLFAWMLGLQLRNLRSVWTEPLLAAMTPLPERMRLRSQQTVQRTAGLAGTLLMAVPVALAAPLPLAAGCAAAGAASAVFFSRSSESRR